MPDLEKLHFGFTKESGGGGADKNAKIPNI